MLVFATKSRLPSSMKRPKGFSARSDSSIGRPASEFSTTSQPPSARSVSANRVSRESYTASAP